MEKCILLVAAAVLATACSKQEPDGAPSASAAPPAAHASQGVKPGSHDDWCGEHQVPESMCTRCDSSLIPAFKATGHWFQEHGVPESQCKRCIRSSRSNGPPRAEAMHHPNWMLALAIVALGCARTTAGENDSSGNGTAPAAAAQSPGKKPLDPKLPAGPRCQEHGAVESLCIKCNPKLEPVFRAKGDWCATLATLILLPILYSFHRRARLVGPGA